MPPLQIIFAGSGAFGLPTLRHLIDSPDFEVVQVVTQPDRPAGRGKRLAPTPVGEFAGAAGLMLVKTENINALPLPPADAMVVIAFGQKISPAAADHARLGSVNLHASRLPKYRGAAPIHWAILNGERVTGNSVIRLAPRMDAGAVLAMSELVIGETETTGELHDRLAADGPGLVSGVLLDLAAGVATQTPQDESAATSAPKLSRADAVIDWARPAAEIVRRINGLSPWPGCRARVLRADDVESDRLTLLRAGVGTSSGAPCAILPDGSVGAGGGSVRVLEVTPAGKRAMGLDDYRRGKFWEPGGRLAAVE